MVELGRVGDSHGDLAIALGAGVRALDSHVADSPLHTASALRYPRARRNLSASEAERLLGFPATNHRVSRPRGWLETRRGWGR